MNTTELTQTTNLTICLEEHGASLSLARMEHHVYFWLNEEHKNAENLAKFEAGLQSLIDVPNVVRGAFGTPAPVKDRPTLDNSWDYALAVTFEDMAGHDEYQVHPDHLAFLENFKAQWAKVRVSDVQSIG